MRFRGPREWPAFSLRNEVFISKNARRCERELIALHQGRRACVHGSSFLCSEDDLAALGRTLGSSCTAALGELRSGEDKQSLVSEVIASTDVVQSGMAT
jgi:hypothetical protein